MATFIPPSFVGYNTRKEPLYDTETLTSIKADIMGGGGGAAGTTGGDVITLTGGLGGGGLTYTGGTFDGIGGTSGGLGASNIPDYSWWYYPYGSYDQFKRHNPWSLLCSCTQCQLVKPNVTVSDSSVITSINDEKVRQLEQQIADLIEDNKNLVDNLATEKNKTADLQKEVAMDNAKLDKLAAKVVELETLWEQSDEDLLERIGALNEQTKENLKVMANTHNKLVGRVEKVENDNVIAKATAFSEKVRGQMISMKPMFYPGKTVYYRGEPVTLVQKTKITSTEKHPDGPDKGKNAERRLSLVIEDAWTISTSKRPLDFQAIPEVLLSETKPVGRLSKLMSSVCDSSTLVVVWLLTMVALLCGTYAAFIGLYF